MNTNPSVLIIEQDRDILAFLSILLERNNIRTLRATSADEAIAIANRNYVPIDLVVSNQAVNGTVGTEVVASLQQVRPGLRALYMSALVEDEMIRVDLVKGASGQPTRSEGLLEEVRSSFANAKVLGAGQTRS